MTSKRSSIGTYSPNSIRIALAAVERDYDNLDTDEPFSTIEKLGLKSVPYNDVIEQGRGFPARVVAAFLNIQVHSYTIDAAIVREARKWLIECNDEYLVEIVLRLHIELRTFFLKRRIRRALATARERFPSLRDLICRYER